MAETEKSDPVTELRQGDIIRIEQAAWLPRLGVIINADCDLSHQKHDGVISFLPLYSFSEYMEQFWCAKYIEQQLSAKKKSLSENFSLAGDEFDSLIRWLDHEGLESVIEKLTTELSIKPKQLPSLKALLDSLRMLSLSEKQPFERFLMLLSLEKDAEAFTKKCVEQAYKEMGEGHYFLSELAGMLDLGFVIRMRRVYSISAAHCFRSESESLKSPLGSDPWAVRIARLTAPFRYRIAQLFAQQFSRIGLPDEITQLSSLALSDVVRQISEKKP